MSKKKAGSFKDGIQTFGRSLLLPIALLAPIGMVMGICSALGQSYMIEKFPILDAAVLKLIISGAKDITSIIFNNIPILFAMGVAQGMAKEGKGNRRIRICRRISDAEYGHECIPEKHGYAGRRRHHGAGRPGHGAGRTDIED